MEINKDQADTILRLIVQSESEYGFLTDKEIELVLALCDQWNEFKDEFDYLYNDIEAAKS